MVFYHISRMKFSRNILENSRKHLRRESSVRGITWKRSETLCVSLFCIEHNVALKGRATQSSQYDRLGDAGKAIDGGSSADYGDGSCIQTRLESKPWWRLDLQETHTVSEVIITNRGDCCSGWISGAEIHIGNSLEDNGNQNPRYILCPSPCYCFMKCSLIIYQTKSWSSWYRCAVITFIPEGQPHTFLCYGMLGRYINILLPANGILTLCEVEVYASRPAG